MERFLYALRVWQKKDFMYWKSYKASQCSHQLKTVFFALWYSAVPHILICHWHWEGTCRERRMTELRSALWTWEKHFALSWKQSEVWLKTIDSQCTDIKTLGPKWTSGLSDLASCTTEAIEFPAIPSSSLIICEACLPERHPIVSQKYQKIKNSPLPAAVCASGSFSSLPNCFALSLICLV